MPNEEAAMFWVFVGCLCAPNFHPENLLSLR